MAGTTGDFAATEGTGKKAATFTITEDAETKFLQRVAIAGSDGSDISGTTADAAYSGTGNGGLIALQKWIGASLVSLLAKLPASIGQKASAASTSVVLASDDPVVNAAGTPGTAAWPGSGNGTIISCLKAIATNALSTAPSPVVGPGSYETVAASQTAQVLGATGAIGDFLSHLLIVPATTSPGAVTVTDGSGSAITVFAGGASSVSNLVAFAVPLGMTSVSGAWKVTTGANVSVIGIGKFT